MTNATHSGMAVRQSAKLWIVSARSATEPLTTTISSCRSAVTARPASDHLMARIPRSVGEGTRWSWTSTAAL